ncbi:MAG: hypothetical protein VYE22_37635 [Myxococcota bacterium]|nr:hypothetical protein [Myxococcota bacterium]
MPRLALCCATIMTCLLTSPAAAQRRVEHAPDRLAPLTSGGSVELGFHTRGIGRTRVDGVSGLLRLRFVFDQTIEIGATAGWAWAGIQNFFGFLDGDAASAANPLIYGGLVLHDDHTWRLRLTGGLAFPAAPNEDQAALAAWTAASMRGYEELWLWAPARLTVVPGVQAEAVPVEFLYLEGTVRSGFLFPLEDRASIVGDTPGEVDVSIETRFTAAFHHPNVLGGGRFRAVFLPTVDESRDQAQLSMDLFLRGIGRVYGAELFGEWRLTMNLDDELGFAFDQGGVWGMFFVFGGGLVL